MHPDIQKLMQLIAPDLSKGAQPLDLATLLPQLRKLYLELSNDKELFPQVFTEAQLKETAQELMDFFKKSMDVKELKPEQAVALSADPAMQLVTMVRALLEDKHLQTTPNKPFDLNDILMPQVIDILKQLNIPLTGFHFMNCPRLKMELNNQIQCHVFFSNIVVSILFKFMLKLIFGMQWMDKLHLEGSKYRARRFNAAFAQRQYEIIREILGTGIPILNWKAIQAVYDAYKIHVHHYLKKDIDYNLHRCTSSLVSKISSAEGKKKYEKMHAVLDKYALAASKSDKSHPTKTVEEHKAALTLKTVAGIVNVVAKKRLEARVSPSVVEGAAVVINPNAPKAPPMKAKVEGATLFSNRKKSSMPCLTLQEQIEAVHSVRNILTSVGAIEGEARSIGDAAAVINDVDHDFSAEIDTHVNDMAASIQREQKELDEIYEDYRATRPHCPSPVVLDVKTILEEGVDAPSLENSNTHKPVKGA